MAKLSFVAQLQKAKHNTYTPTEGANKGTEYKTTALKFNTVEGEDIFLKAQGHVQLPAELLRRDMHWDLEVEPKTFENSTSFIVTKLEPSKLGK